MRSATSSFVRSSLGVLAGALFIAASTECARTRSVEGAGTAASSHPTNTDARAVVDAAAAPAPIDAAPPDLDSGVTASAAASTWGPPAATSIDGPHQDLSLDAGRPVYYALPRDARGLRLVGHLHGMCGAPTYACGKWIGAGTSVGVMVCPTGNARCGDSPVGPPSWEAPTWPELVAIMDRDLETAVAKVEAKRPGTIRREGAILTGYSRGAYAAPAIARRHPNRWRHLVLIEASVTLSAEALRSAGVRSVALVAGDQGNEIAAMRKTQLELERAGFPAQLFVMRGTGHLYSEDMEHVMHDALAFVVAHDDASDAAAP